MQDGYELPASKPCVIRVTPAALAERGMKALASKMAPKKPLVIAKLMNEFLMTENA
jgi:hypothetical protein